MSIEIQGVLADIIYWNESNGYLVGVLENEQDQITIVGNMPAIQRGQTFILTGDYKVHSTYGEQFQFITYKQVLPTTAIGIEDYLSSGVVKGIGPKTAKSIVNKFGTDTLNIMQYSPDRLLEVDGIGPAKAKTIAEAFREQRELMEVSMFLQQYGVTPNYAVKIYKKYGENTIRNIQENPYRLADEIYGIGFKIADNIARKMGIDMSSQYRIKSGIKFVLTQYVLEGNTFMPRDTFVEKVGEALDVQIESVNMCLTELALDDQVQLENLDERIVVFSMPYFKAETNVCKNLIRLARAELEPVKEDIDKMIEEIEYEDNIELEKYQKKGVKEAVNSGVFVLTGGPGTGKTTTINSIIRVFEKCNMSVALAAPTGRAAKRMTESSGREAKTIHRLLEYAYLEGREGMQFSRDQDNPLDYDVVIIDEMSMVDILLMNGLLKAIMPSTRLILVGDSDQLPSVGAGNVLKDIIDSEVINTIKLEKIFRQAQESMIIVNAHRINKGDKPYLNEKDKDFYFMNRRNQSDIINTIKELCTERLPKFANCDTLKSIQVLTPVKKGPTGIYNINNELQKLLNPPDNNKVEKTLRDKILREGDKVMQIKNNYNLEWINEEDNCKGEGVFNGDFGYVKCIDEEENQLTVRFDDGKVVEYEFSQIDELELAYAITVHKSQGSEFSIVVMPITWGPAMLLTRNLLYTAVTRAKKLVVMVGNEKYLSAMVENNQIINRNSGLKNRLRRLLEEQILF